jgi:hypothetical protein
MGGRSKSKSRSGSNNNNNNQQYQQPIQQQDNSMQIWATEMANQRKENARQYEDTRKQYDETRKAEEAQRKIDEAKRDQELWNEKQMAKDSTSLDQYKGATETFANQAGGAPSDSTMVDSTTSAINQRIGDKSKSSAPAPGLTPFGTSIVKPANMMYPTQQARIGGL